MKHKTSDEIVYDFYLLLLIANGILVAELVRVELLLILQTKIVNPFHQS